MDLAKKLIRTVARAFYDTRGALVVDALFIHSVIHAEDLAFLMGMQSKDLRKVCGELKSAKLILSHSKSEVKEGSNRTTSRDYYYIPYHHVIDGIKYRVYKLTSKIKSSYIQSSERKALRCPRCDAAYTELEAMSYSSEEGFICERCSHLLENEDESKIDAETGFEQQSRLMHKMEKIVQLLKQIDQVDVPANDFDDAWAVKVDVRRPESSNRPKFPGTMNNNAPVRGATGSTDAANLSISISTTDELTAAQELEESKRKADLLAKNAKPDWFNKSSVQNPLYGQDVSADSKANGDSTTAGVKRKFEDVADDDERKAAESAAMDDQLKAYYEAMAKEKEQEAKEAEGSSEEESDDEDGFEDVNVGPSSGMPEVKVNGVPAANIKDELESGSSSAPATSTGTPAFSGALDMNGRPAKRIKTQASALKTEESDEDEDDVEFEDVGNVETGTGRRNAGAADAKPLDSSTAAAKDEDSDEDAENFEDV